MADHCGFCGVLYVDAEKNRSFCSPECEAEDRGHDTIENLREQLARIRAQLGEVRNKTINECVDAIAPGSWARGPEGLDVLRKATKKIQALKPAQGAGSGEDG